MDKNKGKKIGIAGNHTTTIDLATNLILNGYKIDCIINMPCDLNGEIAGYVDLGSFAKKNGIRIIRPKTYNLNHKDDKKLISERRIDALLVFGWQRLIPEWFLKQLSIGAFGTHGSWKPLPYGRGRSLLNWSLILGKTRFIDNLFKYDAGADSGDIIDTLSYSISPWDTIAILHHKDQLVHQSLLLKHLPNILENKVLYKPQSKRIKEVFFPKRKPEDGVINWNWTTIKLYNLIRALSKPYPGAFTYADDLKIMIWRAIPFELFPTFSNKKTGEIVANFADETFVVKTLDGTLLIQEYEASKWKPKIGDLLKSGVNKSYSKLKESGIL